MQLDKQLLLTAIGGLTGAAAVDSEGDFFSAPIGAAIGATAANFANIKILNPQNVIHRTTSVNLNQDRKLSDTELLKQKLNNAVVDPNDYSTISRLQGLVSNTESTAYELRQALAELDVGSSLVNTSAVNLETFKQPVLKVAPNADFATKQAALQTTLERMGYSGNELANKLITFNGLLEDSKGLVIKGDAVTFGEHGTIKLTDTYGGNIHNGLYYATQRLNPFAGLAANGYNTPKAVADALGINLIEAGNAEALIEEGMRNGLRPDDLQALLHRSKAGLNQAANEFAGSAYQYQDAANTMLLGDNSTSRQALANELTTRRVLNESSYGTSFNVDSKTGELRTDRLFRKLSTTSKDGTTTSEFLRTREYLSKLHGGFIQEGVKTDKYDVMSIGKNTRLANALNMVERNAYTTGTRGERPNIVATADTFADESRRVLGLMDELGINPREFEGSVPFQRLVVNRETFNEYLDKLGVPSNLRVGDGAGLIGAKNLNQYTREATKVFKIPTNADGKYALHPKLNEYMQKGSFNNHELYAVGDMLTKGLPTKDRKLLESVANLKDYASKPLADLFELSYNEKLAEFKNYNMYANYLFQSSIGKTDKSLLLPEHAAAVKNAEIANELDDNIFKHALEEELRIIPRESFENSLKNGNIDYNALKKTLSKNQRSSIDFATLKHNIQSYNEASKTKRVRKVLANFEQEIREEAKKLKPTPEQRGILAKIQEAYASGNPEEYLSNWQNSTNKIYLDNLKQRLNLTEDLVENHTQKSLSYATSIYNRVETLVGESKLDEVNSLLEEAYNTTKPLMLGSGDILGLDTNGRPIRVSNDYSQWSFRNLREVVDEFGKTSLEVTAIGSHSLGEDSRIKSFGVDSKQGLAIVDNEQLMHTLQAAAGVSTSPDTPINAKLVTNPVTIADKVIVDESDVQGTFLKQIHADLDVMRRGGKLESTELLKTLDQPLANAAISYVQALPDKGYSHGLTKASNMLGALVQHKATGSITQTALYTSVRSVYKTGMFVGKEMTPEHFASMYQNKILPLINGSSGKTSAEIFQDQHFQDFFHNMRDNLYWSSLDSRAGFTYGSGSFDKGMSWNAQKNLIAAGYSKETLDIFGTHSLQDVYDLKAFSQTTKPASNTVNEFIGGLNNSQFTQMMSELRNNDNDKYAEIFKKYGASSELLDGDFINYSLPANELGIETIPLYKQKTYRVGRYVTEDGTTVNKALGTIPLQVIRYSELANREQNSLLKEKHLKTMNELIENYSQEISTSIKGSDGNILKTVSKRYIENSAYSLVGAAEGNLKQAIIDFNTGARDLPVVGVDEAGALQRLKLNGVDVNAEDFKLKNYISSTGTLLDNSGRDLIGLESREPAFSTNSIRTVNYAVIDSGTRSNPNVVYHSSSDKQYSKLMFGDLDFDHVFEYFPKRSLSNSEYNELLNLGVNQANLSRSSMELAEYLGVKGGSGSKVTLSQFIDEAAKLTQDPNEKKEIAARLYSEFLEGSAIKAGQRKSLTPAVTNLANTIFKSVERFSDKGTQVFNDQATIMHYMVENMIKSQHTKTQGHAVVTDVEKLVAARDKFVKNPEAYSKDYFQLLENTLKSFDKSPENSEAKARVNSAIAQIVEAEKVYGTSLNDEVILPTDFGRAVSTTDGTLPEVINKVDEFIHHGKILPTELGDVNVAKTARLGYDEVLTNLKHNIANNKTVLATAAAGLIATNLLTQKNPDFNTKMSATANPSSMMMKPAQQVVTDRKQQDAVSGINFKHQSNYLTNKNYVKEAVRVEGKYQRAKSELTNSVKQSVFGNNISNLRVETYYE
jgi:hypothetical protein